jgi:hypothetical protein
MSHFAVLRLILGRAVMLVLLAAWAAVTLVRLVVAVAPVAASASPAAATPAAMLAVTLVTPALVAMAEAVFAGRHRLRLRGEVLTCWSHGFRHLLVWRIARCCWPLIVLELAGPIAAASTPATPPSAPATAGLVAAAFTLGGGLALHQVGRLGWSFAVFARFRGLVGSVDIFG